MKLSRVQKLQELCKAYLKKTGFFFFVVTLLPVIAMLLYLSKSLFTLVYQSIENLFSWLLQIFHWLITIFFAIVGFIVAIFEAIQDGLPQQVKSNEGMIFVILWILWIVYAVAKSTSEGIAEANRDLRRKIIELESRVEREKSDLEAQFEFKLSELETQMNWEISQLERKIGELEEKISSL
jgi:phage-related protein